MKVYNTKGELVTSIQLDSESERAGQEVVFVIDQEARELQEQILDELKKINKFIEEN